MKNNNVNFKDMYDYVLNSYLTPQEAYYFLKMEGADSNLVPKRMNDQEYFNITLHFIKALSADNRLKELSEAFLLQLTDMKNEDVITLLNICYFPFGLKKKDYINSFRTFYNFFKNTNINYENHKFEIIKNYLQDNDNLSTFFKTLMVIDMNLLTDDSIKLALLLEKSDVSDLEDYFLKKKINIDSFNKRIFANQLKYIRDLYINENIKKI